MTLKQELDGYESRIASLKQTLTQAGKPIPSLKAAADNTISALREAATTNIETLESAVGEIASETIARVTAPKAGTKAAELWAQYQSLCTTQNRTKAAEFLAQNEAILFAHAEELEAAEAAAKRPKPDAQAVAKGAELWAEYSRLRSGQGRAADAFFAKHEAEITAYAESQE